MFPEEGRHPKGKRPLPVGGNQHHREKEVIPDRDHVVDGDQRDRRLGKGQDHMRVYAELIAAIDPSGIFQLFRNSPHRPAKNEDGRRQAHGCKDADQAEAVVHQTEVAHQQEQGDDGDFQRQDQSGKEQQGEEGPQAIVVTADGIAGHGAEEQDEHHRNRCDQNAVDEVIAKTAFLPNHHVIAESPLSRQREGVEENLPGRFERGENHIEKREENGNRIGDQQHLEAQIEQFPANGSLLESQVGNGHYCSTSLLWKNLMLMKENPMQSM